MEKSLASTKETTKARAEFRKSEDIGIKNQQYRLFLLNHSLGCSARTGSCKHAYCPEMKDLLKHMASCRDGSCNVTHCLSSRVLINHCNHCHDRDCPLCEPVKEATMEEYFHGTKRKLSFSCREDEHCSVTKKRKLTI
ncbi:hypothetical protein ACHAXR_011852 [Thalassiosira sp. AJA248-18]